MGWASGAELAGDLIAVIKKVVEDKETRETIYYHLIDKFESHDCDNMCECVGIDKAYDKVYYTIHPAALEDDE